MDIIKRIINESVWHELGHFCLALMVIENNPSYKISSFKFTYIPPRRWSCSVTCINPNIQSNLDLIKAENHNELCFDILNILAGSVFESVYRRITYNQYLNPIHILTRGSAIHDLLSLRELLRILDIDNNKIKNLILGEVLDAFFQIILSNNDFLKVIDPIAAKYSKDVFEKLDRYADLIFNLTEEDIDSLSKDVLMIMKTSSIYSELLTLKERLSVLLN